MTREQIIAKFPHASKSFLRRNDGILGGLETQKPKPDQRGEIKDRKLVEGPAGVGCRIELTSYRRRLLDSHDNLPASCKPLVDAISQSLGLDDADVRLDWCYQQRKTNGAEGVLIRIEFA
jgi:hypothetical protein